MDDPEAGRKQDATPIHHPWQVVMTTQAVAAGVCSRACNHSIDDDPLPAIAADVAPIAALCAGVAARQCGVDRWGGSA